MFDNNDFNESGVYYILLSNQNYSLSVLNNTTTPKSSLAVSFFDDSFYQAFYFLKTEDNSYFIMNINSLKIIGVENISNYSPIIQNFITPSDRYKWKITQANIYEKTYYIELKYNNKRIDIKNNFAIINTPNNYSQSQKFMFRKCLYNTPKSDLWQKWEKYFYRNFLKNLPIQLLIIRSAQNENYVLNLDSYNNNITLNDFNGNKEQIFIVLKLFNNFFISPYNSKIHFIGKEIINGRTYLKLNDSLFKLNINKDFDDNNGNPLYTISDEFNLYLDTSLSYLLEFNFFNGSISQKFYFSLISSSIFEIYLLTTLKYYNSGKNIFLKTKYILDYSLDGFRNMTYLSIDKNTKYISNNVLRKINTLTGIKINVEWINKFNKNNIISIEFNDNIFQLNLNILKNFINLVELHLPLTINSIIGTYKKNIPNVKILECDPKLLKYFDGISLEQYIIHKDIKEINKADFLHINAKELRLFKNIKKIQLGAFDNISFNIIICYLHHIKYLNKNIISIIFLLDDEQDTIYSNTFENFINLKLVKLPKNLKKIESKGFNNCRNLAYINLPESCTDVRWDSFFKCGNLEIDCKDEIKEKLKRNVEIKNKYILTKYDLKDYTSIEGLEIDLNTKVNKNALENLTNLKEIKCNPEILNMLPLAKYKENNLTTIIIQDGAKKLTKEMFKYCLNLEFISIPLSVKEIEEGTFDQCKNLRIVECDPCFLKYFREQYITTFIIQEGVKSVYKNQFNDINYIQYFIIPESVKYIEKRAFYDLKRIIYLKCEEKWENNEYFPFKYEIKEGTKIIDPEIFNGWFNLRTLIIPNSVNTILPFTFAYCRMINYLKCSPEYFNFLYVKNVKVLVLPEGVERLNNGDLKGFVNLIYLRLPNSIKFIEEDVFNDTPCLNFENISDHPIIRRLKVKKFIEEFNINKFKSDFDKLLLNFPSVDVPNYNFEKSDNSLKKKKNENENSEDSSDSEDKYEEDEDQDKNEEEKNDSLYEHKNEVKNEEYNQNKKEQYLFQDKKGMNNIYNYKNSDNIQGNKNNYKKNKLVNNFIKNGKKKTERTVEDIVEYDPTNKKYAPFIKIIIDSINKEINNVKKGNLLQELSYKLASICIKIKNKYNFTPRPVQILAILRLADSIFNNDGKGSIGEIKTGEGKSFIVSTLAILL